MKKRQLQDHDECPVCGRGPEKILHVLRCTDERMRLWWQHNLSIIHQWMIDNDGMPELVRAIMARLNQWSQDPFLTPPFRSRSTSVSRTITDQDAIGWYQFILGRVGRSFAETQHEHLQSIFKKRTGLRWVQALINKLWDVSWDMWAHRNGIKHNTVTHSSTS